MKIINVEITTFPKEILKLVASSTVLDSTQVPYSTFKKPQEVTLTNGRIYIVNDIEGFSKKKVFQHVSIFFVIGDSLLKDKKDLIKMDISVLTLKPSVVYRKSVFEPFNRLSWSLRIPDEFRGALVLCSYMDGTHSSYFSYILVPDEFPRKIRKLIREHLEEAASKRGLSYSDEPFIHEYVNREKYKKIYGYDPEISHDDIKEEEMFKLLNIEPCKDISIIRTAYKKMIKENHPDVIGEENTEEANKKMKDIINAYEYLYQRYGNSE